MATVNGKSASFTGIFSGTITLTGTAASSFTTSSGNLTIDSSAILNLGNTNATSITIGHTGVVTNIVGNVQINGVAQVTPYLFLGAN